MMEVRLSKEKTVEGYEVQGMYTCLSRIYFTAHFKGWTGREVMILITKHIQNHCIRRGYSNRIWEKSVKLDASFLLCEKQRDNVWIPKLFSINTEDAF